MMTCIAIDDEPLALSLLEKYIERFNALTLLRVFEDPAEAVAYLKGHAVDLIFTDINMPGITGLELVSGLNRKPMVIFTTAHKKYALDGFELEAIDYLLKPISPERFERAVQKAFEQYRLRNPDETEASIVVRSEYKMVKIELSDIEYIEAMEDYIKIHRFSADYPVLTLMSLKGILEFLPASQFSRIHRSFIVPDAQVRSIQGKKVKLRSGRELPVSDSYLDFIEQWRNTHSKK